MKWFYQIHILLVGLLLIGCATSPGLKRYSRVVIERPLTLPATVAAWEFRGNFGYAWSTRGSEVTPPRITPYYFQTAMTDTVTVKWHGLFPYAIDWLAYQDEATQYAITAEITDVQRGVIAPGMRWKVRHRLDYDSAIDWEVSLPTAVDETRPDAITLLPGFSAGKLCQLNRHVAIKSEFALETRRIDSVSYATVPVRFSVYWNFDRHWDFTANYGYHRLGLPHKRYEHQFGFQFTHLW